MLVFLSGFEGLQKAFTKAKSVVEKEGSTPVFYIRTLTELEDFVMGVCKQTGKYILHTTVYSSTLLHNMTYVYMLGAKCGFAPS